MNSEFCCNKIQRHEEIADGFEIGESVSGVHLIRAVVRRLIADEGMGTREAGVVVSHSGASCRLGCSW